MLDPSRFAALWAHMHLSGTSEAPFEELVRAYSEPQRTYHNTSHIADCLAQLDLEPDAPIRMDEVEMALWYHDAVYDSHADDNEARSASWAVAVLAAADAATDVQQRVRALILATQHTSVPQEHDAQVVTDVDLSILGRSPAVFANFERRIRQEYAWVAETEYRRARRAVLVGFLARTPLYQTPGYRARYEDAARRNLGLAVNRLADPG